LFEKNQSFWYNVLVVKDRGGNMDIPLKVLGIIIGFGFSFVGVRFLFYSTKVIQGIQKYKFKTTSTPKKQELIFSKIIGVLLLLMGLYYMGIAIVSLF